MVNSSRLYSVYRFLRPLNSMLNAGLGSDLLKSSNEEGYSPTRKGSSYQDGTYSISRFRGHLICRNFFDLSIRFYQSEVHVSHVFILRLHSAHRCLILLLNIFGEYILVQSNDTPPKKWNSDNILFWMWLNIE